MNFVSYFRSQYLEFIRFLLEQARQYMPLSKKEESDKYSLLECTKETWIITSALKFGDKGSFFSERDGVPLS